MENSIALEAKILTVSDGVVVGEREDISGGNLQKLLEESGWMIKKRAVVKDGSESVSSAIIELAEGFHGLIVLVADGSVFKIKLKTHSKKLM